MFNKFILKDILLEYKKEIFSAEWENQKYKWEAIKCFQDNWDVNAENFLDMLRRSLNNTFDLLDSTNNFPRLTIEFFAKMAPEEIRAMFISLYDESKDIYDRIKIFKDQSSIIIKKYGNNEEQHYQYENAISVYLWLRYPDKYYIYKYEEIKTISDQLKSDYVFKKGANSENIRNAIKLYGEICDELKMDSELVNLFRSHLSNTCYPDPELKTLALDIGRYISRRYLHKDSDNVIISRKEWFPNDYEPCFTVDDWIQLLKDKSVFTESSLKIVYRIKDCGGQATANQLSIKYGETENFYNIGSISLAVRIFKKTGCPIIEFNNDDIIWWTILYVIDSKDDKGNYIWKLRDELSEALDKCYISQFNSFLVPESEESDHNYWWLNANPKIWSFSSIAVGEVQAYTLYNENGNKRRIFKNFLEAKTGDIVIGYESNTVKQIVAIARVIAEHDGEKLYFEKKENLVYPIHYGKIRKCPELQNMECFVNTQGSLFKLTKDEFEFIMDIIRDDNIVLNENFIDTYTKDDFLEEVYMSEKKYDQLVAVLRHKKNLILQGSPGVGKTFSAKRLAYSMMGEKDDNRIEFVQFHQNYSYEDFMMGYKPFEDGFELKNGIFYCFCQKASNQLDKDYFFIIDEINRGNMSKIFGELLMLIEKDYRGVSTTLAYNGLPFSVPPNLYIIGIMNTADRSLAMIDYALRRRFSFLEMEPGFDSEGFIKYQNRLNNETFNDLINKVRELNKKITSDKSLGKGFCIGHSYFCGNDICTDEWLHSIVDFDIIPMLSEYWFDNMTELQFWENILHGVFQ